tara:strand:- start:46 stop:2955 length:2910 start_codon:yes stop_codon:yes gene_type:complete
VKQRKNKTPSFIDKDLLSLLRGSSSFFLKGGDFRLLPLLLPFVGGPVLVFYSDLPEKIYRGLLLFFKNDALFFQQKYLQEDRSVEGFVGSFDQQKSLFFSALEASFKNHPFVFLDERVVGKKVFKRRRFVEGFCVSKKTGKEELISVLASLGFVSSDIVQDYGQCCDRGLVVDFFPKGSSFGVRVVFDDLVEVFAFDVESQLVIKPLKEFHLVRCGDVFDRGSIEELVDFSSYKKVFICEDGLSFYDKDPRSVFPSPFSSIGLEQCVRSSEVFAFDSPCLVGFLKDGQVFAPSWTQNNLSTKDFSNNLYVDFSKLERGDFVIHSDFGVGEYCGLSFSKESEFMVLKYQQTKINVYPPYFDRVSFYKKSGSGVVSDSIGSGGWKRRVSSAKKAASDVAAGLVKDYLGRKQASSDKYYFDKDIENRLLDGFDFRDTKDQSLAWGEIKKDLLSSRPMERLLCGDVGFGKTELAVRACFLSAFNGFGSLVLAPTTVLAKQLFSSFSRRLSVYGVSVGFVSRFVDKKDQLKTISLFLDGKIDVLVGTHRIILDKACLKKASLVVVDDEHRFGVRQKEGVKRLSPGVNLLYMSATPIPRTLKMALSSITSISTLSTPPSFKLPTTTYIEVFSPQVIEEAVLDEVSRGGQVFFIHNQVKTIPSVVSYLKKLIPSVSVDFLHGQEESGLIEKKMGLFTKKKIQVLVASSIVENGIDIPSVNTIIVNNAHLFGVSQLYQLRGRVGRSSKPSFAFLLIPSAAALSKTARERLKIIQKNSSLGSFYTVSLEDLSLRGGGAVFGYRQSGIVGRVGFELYDRFLNSAVRTVLGEKVFKTRCSFVSIRPGFIPRSYLSTDRLRVWFYKELSSCETVGQLNSFVVRVRGVFGKPPVEVESLLDCRRKELWGGLCCFSKIIQKDSFVDFYLDLFFWENKIDTLFTALFGYKFTLLNGGRVVRVPLEEGCVLSFLKSVFGEIKNVK